MNSAIIDNAIGADITRCITCQFDKATRLVGIITALKDFYDQSTGELWDGMIDSVENIDEANDYGLSVWGKILNVKRPIVITQSHGVDQDIFYTKYTGKLIKVNSPFPYYSTSLDFYFHNSDFDLVPLKKSQNIYDWFLWGPGIREYTNDYIGYEINVNAASPVVDFVDGFYIGPSQQHPVPPEQIDGGTTFTHEYVDYTKSVLSSNAYRKILKGRFALMNGNAELGIVGNASMSDYVKYVNYIFDGKVSVTEGPSYSTPEAMSMTFADNGLDGELLDLFTNHKDIAFLYPCGVHDNNKSSSLRFGLDPSHTTHRSDRGGLGESSFTWN